MRDFGGGGSIFDEFFGMGTGGARGRQRQRGEDLRLTIQLTLEEIAKGLEKSIRVKRLIKCESCKGSGVAAGASKKTCSQCGGNGQVRQITKTFLGTMQHVATCSVCRGTGEIISDPCRDCHGDGRIKGESTVKLNIPAGVSSGNYMTIDGMGNVAVQGGEPGDLVAIFEETEHEYFTRQGDNVLCELPVSFSTAALGGTINVRTLLGEEALKIPSGTQPGKVLVLRGKGIPHLHKSGRGDQLIQINVWVPTKLSAEEKQILQNLAEKENMTPPNGNRSFFEKLRQTFGA
jgi:molecular chaperone DnaJ